jgi:hypothetical protein
MGTAGSSASDYVGGLTPARLRADTRVTAHRRTGERAAPYAAVLQAGTAVLVDDRGLPRVRCADGAPLAGAAPLTDPVYGAAWPGFDPARTVDIRPAGGRVAEFGLVDTAGRQAFRRPAGTTGDEDVESRPDTGRLEGGYTLTGDQTGCDGLQDCQTAGPLTLTPRFTGCPTACAVSDVELGDGVPLTGDGATWKAAGTVPAQRRVGVCDGAEVPYAFTTTFTVTDSAVVDGVWTATRLRAEHRVSAPQTGNCTGATVAWAAEGGTG